MARREHQTEPNKVLYARVSQIGQSDGPIRAQCCGSRAPVQLDDFGWVRPVAGSAYAGQDRAELVDGYLLEALSDRTSRPLPPEAWLAFRPDASGKAYGGTASFAASARTRIGTTGEACPTAGSSTSSLDLTEARASRDLLPAQKRRQDIFDFPALA